MYAIYAIAEAERSGGYDLGNKPTASVKHPRSTRNVYAVRMLCVARVHHGRGLYTLTLVARHSPAGSGAVCQGGVA